MKYLLLILLLVLIIPINQVIYAQSIVDEISKVFDNLTSGLLGNKNTTDPSTTVDMSLGNINNTN
ncbi:hypothetical protein NMY3_00065 [Candidatus Nitrosocosmicus oleophilus]|uniref:Uncharacterized protein n=1 Tax=Candidatus Nitrosocosmicus oleophilus TaxID=1353260 RepID=A0A654LV73_9ARCH|nr:hypothetical protein [Candidatus Nitrosocosmicus oleophilus]ALI34279.1 hypothetical protein NMY3_00065 [Candidatus Nitrosocosmicus oleophilus]